MSDGDRSSPDATAGPRGPDRASANPWLTRTPRPSLAAAPWERQGFAESEPEAPADAGKRGADSGGNHTDGVSVAELIARMDSERAGRRRTSRHSAADEHDVADEQDAVTTRFPVIADSEVPDLAAAARRRRAEALLRPDTAATTTIPAVNGTSPGHVIKPKTTKKKHRGRRPVMVAGRLAVSLLSVVALLLTGAAWHWSASKDRRLKYISALDPDSRDIVDPNAQFGDENFLIVGVDSRYGENADMGAGNTADAGGARSDTVMLVNIPASRKRVVAVSFPRDLAIKPLLCDAWDPQTGKYGPVYDSDTGSYGPPQVYTETKLNSAYAFGGPKCLVKEIQKLSGLSINRFIAIDFAGFARLVDALGGVKVCSTTPLEDYELGTVLPQAGWQTIDGRTALNYVRARQVVTEGNGDYGRIKRQQLFLSSLLRSLISNETFYSLKKLNDVVNTFINDSTVDNVKTKDLVDLGQSIQGLTAGHVTFFTVPTTGETDSEGNEPLRADDNRALFNAIINDDPLPGENNLNETTTPTPAPDNTALSNNTSPSTTSAPQPNAELVNAVTTEPQNITVHVSNSTGEDGLAATAANELEQRGFKVQSPDDYSSSLQATTVFFSPGNEQAAATVASALSNPQLERVTGMGNVVQVVLGSDFNSVSSPPPSGSAVQVQVSHTATATPTPPLPKDLSVTNAADTTCE